MDFSYDIMAGTGKPKARDEACAFLFVRPLHYPTDGWDGCLRGRTRRSVITKSPFAFEIAKPAGLGVFTSIILILMNKI